MRPGLPQAEEFVLALAGGSRFLIAAGDEGAASVVSQLAAAMGLGVSKAAPLSGTERRLLVHTDPRRYRASPPRRHESLPADRGTAVLLTSCAIGDELFVQLLEISLVLARDAQARGGLLLHGALAERKGSGVILAAPGGTGKSTASERLRPPWRSLCDDTTLVVMDSQGKYWAHPWPTWSRFLTGEPGGTWDVQHAVPLEGIFFLSQSVTDRVESVGAGHAASLLVECAEQASQLMARGRSSEEARALRLERFDNLCGLARAMPTHVLQISLTGAFWGQIEQALGGRDGRHTDHPAR